MQHNEKQQQICVTLSSKISPQRILLFPHLFSNQFIEQKQPNQTLLLFQPTEKKNIQTIFYLFQPFPCTNVIFYLFYLHVFEFLITKKKRNPHPERNLLLSFKRVYVLVEKYLTVESLASCVDIVS